MSAAAAPGTGGPPNPGELILAPLRLDRWSSSEVERRADRALDLRAGGFILFGGEADAVTALTARLRKAAGRELWFAADLERGAGQQFRGLTQLPPPAALAAAPDPAEATTRAGAVTAREALSVGVNWVLAPVLDLDVEVRNPIVSTRSFGSDPERVADLGRRWIAACQGAGAAACAKHFPGHGRTVTDSHVELPTVEADAEALELDLAPFRRVAPEVWTMMMAHVAYPALAGRDPGRRPGPASRSPAIIRDLLREELGFRGAVATDAMIMAGAGEDGARAAVEAVRAGCDLVLYPDDVGATVTALGRAADEDAGFAERLAAAARLSARTLARVSRGPGTEASAAGSRAIGADGSADMTAAAALALETLRTRAPGIRSWSPSAPTRIVALSDDAVETPLGEAGDVRPGAVLREALAEAGWNVGAESAPSAQTIVVLAATPRGWKGRIGVPPALAGRARSEIESAGRGLLVFLGHARDFEALGLPGICAWSADPVMERAAAAWIDREAGGPRSERRERS